MVLVPSAFFSKRRLAILVLVLALVSVVGIAYVLPGGAAPTRPFVAGSTTSSSIPSSAQDPPIGRIHEVRGASLALTEACHQAPGGRVAHAVERSVLVLEKFAREYPDARFPIDGKREGTFVLLVDLRTELQGCDPSLLDGVEALLPAD